jgi:hypothetical protein
LYIAMLIAATPDVEILRSAVAVAHRVVWATVTTVDGRGRPRSRVVHPVWSIADDGRVEGWITTRRTPVKVRHLAGNPHVACSYLAGDHDVAAFDCIAEWVDDLATRRRVWDLCAALPPPAGFDPAAIFPDGPEGADFALLRLRPYRVLVGLAVDLARGERPRVWRASEGQVGGAATRSSENP